MSKLRIHIIALIIAMCAGGLLSVKLGQDINYDLLNYHYYTPHALLEGRLDFDVAPAQHQTFQNPLIDVPAYALLSNLKPIIAGALLGALHGVAIWLVFEIALVVLEQFKLKRRHQVALSGLIGLVSITGAATISELGGTMGDNITGLFILLGVWLLLLGLRREVSHKHSQYLRFAAFFSAGLALGFKLTNLMFVVGLAVAGVLAGSSWPTKLKNTALHGAAGLLGLLLSGGGWLIYLWRTVSNPIFPFYNEIFKSPYYPTINFLDNRWFPEGEKQTLFYPYYFIKEQSLAVEIPFKDPRLAVLYSVLIIAGIVFIYKKLFLKKPIFATWNKPIWAFWIFMIISYVLWQKQFSNYRYLIVIELLSLVGIAIITFTLIKNKRLATVLVLVALLLIPLNTKAINWGRISWQQDYFGPDLEAHLDIPENSTVLITGGNPFSYLVPYLPEQTRVIRIDSNMLNPKTKTPLAEYNKVKGAILEQESKKTVFYSFLTNDETVRQKDSLQVFGYTPLNCHIIETHSNSYIFKGAMEVSLCRIDKVND